MTHPGDPKEGLTWQGHPLCLIQHGFVTEPLACGTPLKSLETLRRSASRLQWAGAEQCSLCNPPAKRIVIRVNVDLSGVGRSSVRCPSGYVSESPFPECGEDILLHQRHAMLANFEVGCPSCKAILHTSDLMKQLRRSAKEAEGLTAEEQSSKDAVSAESISRKTCP